MECSVLSHSVISTNPPVVEFELLDESTIKRMRITTAEFDGVYGTKWLESALDRINEATSILQWSHWWQLQYELLPGAEYIFVTKARACKLYQRSAEWLRKELKKVPCPIPCRDVQRKGFWLLSSENDRLEQQLAKP